MFIVNAFGVEDDKLYDTWKVEGDEDTERFQEEWENALSSVKEENPDEWYVSEVVERMRLNGWEITGVETAEVSY
jgi:hypothetical protein